MTIINTTHHFIYVHIPKTAGTSVKRFFGQLTRYCDLEIGGALDAEPLEAIYWKRFRLRKHAAAREIFQAIGPERYAGYYKFTFVRDPFVRTLSTFRFLKFTFRNWKKAAVMDDFGNLEEFVCSKYFLEDPGPDRILIPQARWLTDDRNRTCVDFVGQVERIEQDIVTICQKLTLPLLPEPIGKRNVSTPGPGELEKDLANARVVDRIRDRYSMDFEMFGYARDPQWGAIREYGENFRARGFLARSTRQAE